MSPKWIARQLGIGSWKYLSNNAGDLQTVTYSDGITPAVSYTFDRLGRQYTIAQNGITTTLAYNLAGQALSESYSGGTLNSLSVSNGYDGYMRRTNLVALRSGVPLASDSFGYDLASRLHTVTDNSSATPYSATYAYVANSPLIGQITFKQNATVRMTTTNQFDFLNRLTRKSSIPSAGSTVSFNYAYNSANQRTFVTNADGSFWAWTYDALGQVTSGKKYWSDGSAVAGQQFTYGFDDIGNRHSASRGGDSTGANLRTATYTVNNLNQYTQRTVPGYVDVLGSANPSANVMVLAGWGPFAWNTWYGMASRHSDYFRAEIPVGSDNSSGPLWISVTNIGVLPGGTSADVQASVTGNVFLPKTPQPFYYDKDGNLTNDGRWTYTWDAENRLVAMAAASGVGPAQSLKFEYDAKGRRIHKQVWATTNWTGTATTDLRFVYDGWNLIATLNPQLSLLNSFLWGLDLSGSLQGAGGIGGLLESVYYGSQATNCFVAFDGNGNAAALVDAGSGTIDAQYEYGPFGEVLRSTQPVAKANPLRFSTKYEDDETGLTYYGYRYEKDGSWISRDPKGSRGGANPYVFAINAAIANIDAFGLVARIGGEKVMTKDVTFLGTDSKIGNVEVWTEVTIDGGHTHAIWIQFNKVAANLACKWAQFASNHKYNKQKQDIDDTLQVGGLGNKFFRKTKTWYADIDVGQSSPWYAASVTDGNSESVWDEPNGDLTEEFPSFMMEFQTCLLCRAVKSSRTDPYMPAFQVTWKKDFAWLSFSWPYTVQEGRSISAMPNGFTGKDWEKGLDASGQKLTVKSPIIYGEGW